jgi:hypothetical protein
MFWLAYLIVSLIDRAERRRQRKIAAQPAAIS